MRPSLVRVRCWFSSTDFDSPSTLSLTSPTRCRTIFFEAHAVVPPRANAVIAIAPISFFIAVCSFLETSGAGAAPGGIPAPGADLQVLVLRLHGQPVPAGGR